MDLQVLSFTQDTRLIRGFRESDTGIAILEIMPDTSIGVFVESDLWQPMFGVYVLPGSTEAKSTFSDVLVVDFINASYNDVAKFAPDNWQSCLVIAKTKNQNYQIDAQMEADLMLGVEKLLSLVELKDLGFQNQLDSSGSQLSVLTSVVHELFIWLGMFPPEDGVSGVSDVG